MYTLILFVFIQAIGAPVGFASTTPFSSLEDCQLVGEREMANLYNPATRYTCDPAGDET